MTPRTTPSLSPRVAFLRGVNVGANKVSMPELRETAISLGFTDVSTLINSGNLIYGGSSDTTAIDEQRLREAIAGQLGVRCAVLVRTRDELATVLRACPLPTEAAADPAKLLVTLWDADTTPAMRDLFAQAPVSVERFVVNEHAIYCWLPNGVSASVPYEKAARALGDHITARNWSTMQKLLVRLESLS
jgi:uncharacterized protein (DUF1697 family)